MSGIRTIPANEMAQRGRQVSRIGNFIPYTAMTKGEMKLALLREQAQIYAQAYPDYPVYKEAVLMLDTALAGGVSAGVNFVRAIPDDLQAVARQIVQASKMRQPAAGSFIQRESLISGFRIGEDPIVPTQIVDCVQYATKEANRFYGHNWSWTKWRDLPPVFPTKAKKERWTTLRAQCQVQKEIEDILNANITRASHHVVYKSLVPDFQPIVGSQVLTKRLLHQAGVGALGLAATVDSSMMDMWSETGIMRNNANNNLGVLGSEATSMMVAPNPEKYLYDYKTFLLNKKDTKMKNLPAGIGAIGVEPVTTATVAIVTMITTAIAFAAKIYDNVSKKKSGVFAAANGYGTPAYKAEKDDFLTQGGGGTIPPAGKSDNNNLLLLGAAAAGIYFITQD